MTAQTLLMPETGAPMGVQLFGPNAISTNLGSAANQQFNAASDGLAIVFRATATTMIDLISFFVPTVTTAGTAGNVEGSVQTVGTDGLPTGTIVTNSATGTVAVSTTGVKTVSGIAGTAALVVGTLYALVLQAGAGWDRDLLIRRHTGASISSALPFQATKDGAAAWVQSTNIGAVGLNIGVANSGGTYLNIPGLVGATSALALQSVTDATNPDERGNRFSYPVPRTIIGVILHLSGGAPPATDDDFRVALFTDHTGGSPTMAASTTVDGSEVAGTGPMFIPFDAAVDIAANTAFALAVKATGAGTWQITRWTWGANGELAGFAGINTYATTRNADSGAFTDDNVQAYSIFPVFSKADDGAGSGTTIAGTPMRRGMV